MRRSIPFLLVGLSVIAGCYPEEVSFSSQIADPGETITISGRLKVNTAPVDGKGVGGMEVEFYVDPPLQIQDCFNDDTQVDPISATAPTTGGRWKAMMVANPMGTSWSKGGRSLFHCDIHVPGGTAGGDYFIRVVTNTQRCSNNGGVKMAADVKNGGKIHVN